TKDRAAYPIKSKQINIPEHRAEASEIGRSLIEKIFLTQDESEKHLVVDLHGDLGGNLILAVTITF
ncbi:MAG: hypothetical protein WBV78_21120, partial [Roseobacter sp.]